MNSISELLFSYGTLQLEKVQMKTYGRKLIGIKDRLAFYQLERLSITDSAVLEKSGKQIHPIAIRTNNSQDFIEGYVFKITERELLETDQYEVSNYKRVRETLISGKKAWVYVTNEF